MSLADPAVCDLAFLFVLVDLCKDNIKSIKIISKCNNLIIEDEWGHSLFTSYLFYQEIFIGTAVLLSFYSVIWRPVNIYEPQCDKTYLQFYSVHCRVNKF